MARVHARRLGSVAMVVMLGVGFVPPPVQGVGYAVPGRSDELRSGSPAPSITPASAPWVPPWHVQSAPQPWAPPWGVSAPVDPFAPVVVEYVSPSALETIELCPRKWAFPKLDRVPKESNAAADLGTAMHAQHDRFYTTGVPYDLTSRAGELALATDHLRPDRDTPGLRVEQEIRFRDPALPNVWFGGKVDLNWSQPAGEYVRPNEEPRLVRVVLDHKSTGNIEHAKITRAELLGHPQATVYAKMFFVGLGEERREIDGRKVWVPWGIAPPHYVELRWNYVTTKNKPKAFKSWHTVTREDIAPHFEEHVIAPARKLLAIVEEANISRAMRVPFGAAQVEAKPGNACFAFGGCPFRSRCNIAPIEGVKAIMSDPQNSFLNRVGVQPAGGWQPPGQPGQPQHSAPPPGAWQPPGQPQGGPPPGYGTPPGQPVNGAGQPAYGAPPPGQQQYGAPPPNYGTPPQGGAPGYGAQINPPENGQQQQNTGPAVDSKTEEKARKAAEKAAEKERKAAEKAAAGVVAGAEIGGGVSFEGFAMAHVMATLAPAMLPQIMANQMQPGSVAELAHAIVQRASQLGVK